MDEEREVAGAENGQWSLFNSQLSLKEGKVFLKRFKKKSPSFDDKRQLTIDH
jgi:hypothetical protein